MVLIMNSVSSASQIHIPPGVLLTCFAGNGGVRSKSQVIHGDTDFKMDDRFFNMRGRRRRRQTIGGLGDLYLSTPAPGQTAEH